MNLLIISHSLSKCPMDQNTFIISSDSLKPCLSESFVRTEQEQLDRNNETVQNLLSWMQGLQEESIRFNNYLQAATHGMYGRSNDEIYLQSPLPVFSLTSSNTSPRAVYHVTPIKAARESALTPISLRKYKKGNLSPYHLGRTNINNNINRTLRITNHLITLVELILIIILIEPCV